MFSVRSGAVTLALSAFALCYSYDSGASRAARTGAEPVVVGLAEGVMASMGAKTPEPQCAAPSIAFDTQTGQTIYVPTGEVVEEVISVTARRASRVASTAAQPTASHVPHGNHCDADAGPILDAEPSAT